MTSKQPYWIGKRPSNGKKWSGATQAQVIEDAETIEAAFHIYRRYVKQFNDVELDETRNLAEHTQEICGAKVASDTRRFILQIHTENGIHWILEIWYAPGFRCRYRGSCARNTMRSTSDIKGLHLHFTDGGQQAFAAWLQLEQQTNQGKGEWTQYK